MSSPPGRAASKDRSCCQPRRDCGAIFRPFHTSLRILPTIAARAASDSAVEFLLHWLDVWHIENEAEFFRIGLEVACRFNFPAGDPRIWKVLSYFVEHPLDWTLFEVPEA